MLTSLTKKIGLALFTALSLLVLISWASFRTVSDAHDAAEEVDRAQKVLSRLEKVVAHFMTAESEGRAYLATLDESQQRLYEAVVPRVRQELALLRGLTAANTEQQYRLQKLEDLIRQRLNLLSSSIELARNQSLSPEKRIALIREGSELREEVRRQITTMESEEDRSLAEFTAKAEASARWTSQITLGSNLIATACLVLAGLTFWRDHTAQQRAQAALYDREVRLRTLVDHMAEGMLTIDDSGRIQSFNPAAEGMFGYTATEVVGRNIGLLIRDFNEVDQARALAEYGRAIGPDSPGTRPELVGERKDGSTFPLELSVGQFLLREGRFFTAIMRDISERKQAAEQLRANEEKYRLLFEHNPLPLWLIDTKTQAFLDVNEAAVQHYGYARDEWLSLKVRDIRPAEDVPEFEAKYEAAHEPTLLPGPRRYGISRHCTKDGNIILVDITFEHVFLQGRAVHFCLGQDVTEQVRSEKALRREKEFVESLIETVPAIVLVLDTAGRIVRINSFLEELTGYRREQVQGQDWFTTFLPERDRARLREQYDQAIAADHAPLRGFTNRILTHGGHEREIEWSSKWLRYEQGGIRGVLSLGHDITELKQAQEKMLQAERLAAIGQMVTGLAHESRNALQRSLSCLEMLSWEVRDRSRATELIGRVQQAQGHLQHLYEAVRGYAAPIRPNLQNCLLDEVLQDAWDQIAHLRKGRSVQLVWNPAPRELYCEADALALGQVMRNILENALAACADPTVITVNWSETVLEGRAALRLAIHDNGPGLTPEVRQRIFEPFFTTKTHGTGLGMAICKRIVEAHYGQLAVGGNGARGAEIVITLPREAL